MRWNIITKSEEDKSSLSYYINSYNLSVNSGKKPYVYYII